MPVKEISHIHYKRGLFSVTEIFLNSAYKTDADINYFIQCTDNIQNKLDEFYTLLIDLGQTEEQIKSKFYHRTLTEINSFLTNQQFDYHLSLSPEKEELSYFIKLYNQFAETKKIRKAETFRLRAYQAQGILAISYIKQNNNFLWINFYRITSQRAVNISSFEGNDFSGNNSRKGRAHRALHWLDIKEFKKHEINYYDFGGWYAGKTNEELLRINAFKEQFSGDKVKEYTGVIYNHKLLLLLKKLFLHEQQSRRI